MSNLTLFITVLLISVGIYCGIEYKSAVAAAGWLNAAEYYYLYSRKIT